MNKIQRNFRLNLLVDDMITQLRDKLEEDTFQNYSRSQVVEAAVIRLYEDTAENEDEVKEFLTGYNYNRSIR